MLGAVMALVLAAILAVPAARAGACNMRNAADTTAATMSTAEFEASPVSHASISNPGAAYDCCGKSLAAGGCSIVHNFACADALSPAISNFAIHDTAVDRIGTGNPAVTVYEPVPDFRPPRLTA